MKKFVLIVMTLVLTISMVALVGCGGGDNGSSSKTYIIATDTVFAPFEYTDDNGEFVGIDVDLLAAIAEDQGFEYELQSLGFDSALAAVESGQARATDRPLVEKQTET